MVEALVGAVIMVVATTSLLFAVEVAENAFRSAGNTPLSRDEETLLTSLAQEFSLDTDQLLDEIEGQLTQQLPKEFKNEGDF